MEKTVFVIEKISKWSGKAFSWLILVLTATICYEVMVRYFFASPTIWAHELATMIYGSYCLMMGAYTYLYNGHVRMDALYHRFSRRTKATVDLFTGLLALGFLSTLSLMLVKHAVTSWALSETSTLSPWEPILCPFKATLAVTALLLLLQQIAWLIRNFAVVLNKKGFPDFNGRGVT